MRRLTLVLAVLVAGIGLVSLAVSAGDRSILVPPPESVAEDFGRALVHRRLRALRAEMAPELAERTGEADVDAWRAALPRHVEQVEGEALERSPELAHADALFRSPTGDRRLPLRLRRVDGLWRVTAVEAR